MSVYSTGAESYRDTTKWLVALVPLASLVTAAAVIGPRLVSGEPTAGSWGSWLTTYWAALVGSALIVVGLGLLVASGAGLLSTEPKEYDKILEDGTRLSKAFGAGVGFPYFLTADGFKDAVKALNVAQPDDPTVPLERAVSASTQLLEWSFFDALRTKFIEFKRRFMWCIALIVVGLIMAVVAVDLAPSPISQPTAADVRLSSSGTAALIRATGCKVPTATRFVAVAGTWSSPVLEADGPGCRISVQWRPSSGQAQVLPRARGYANPSGWRRKEHSEWVPGSSTPTTVRPSANGVLPSTP